MAIPWFQGFLGVGLLEFEIRLPDFGKFSLPGQNRSVLPPLIPLHLQENRLLIGPPSHPLYPQAFKGP